MTEKKTNGAFRHPAYISASEGDSTAGSGAITLCVKIAEIISSRLPGVLLASAIISQLCLLIAKVAAFFHRRPLEVLNAWRSVHRKGSLRSISVCPALKSVRCVPTFPLPMNGRYYECVGAMSTVRDQKFQACSDSLYMNAYHSIECPTAGIYSGFIMCVPE